MTSLKPLSLPTDHDGWMEFVTVRPTTAVARVAETAERFEKVLRVAEEQASVISKNASTQADRLR